MKDAAREIAGAARAVATGVAVAARAKAERQAGRASQEARRLEPEADRAREDAVRPGPPYQLAAEKITSILDLELDDAQMSKASMAMHYGLAISWSPLYPLLRRHTDWHAVVAGLATGAAMSLVADELMTPAFGFSAPNLEYPLVTHARGFVAHLVFGLVVAATFEVGGAIARRRP